VNLFTIFVLDLWVPIPWQSTEFWWLQVDHRLFLFNLLLAVREGGWRPAAAPPGSWHTWVSLRVPSSTSCGACPRTPPACCSPWISVCNGTWHRSVCGWHDYEDTINTTRRVALFDGNRSSVAGWRTISGNPSETWRTITTYLYSSNATRTYCYGNTIVVITSSCQKNNINN